MNTLDRVKKVVAAHHCMPVADVRNDSLLNSPAQGFDGDSLDRVEIVMSLEDEFGIEIPVESLEQLHTVQQVADHLAALKQPA